MGTPVKIDSSQLVFSPETNGSSLYRSNALRDKEETGEEPKEEMTSKKQRKYLLKAQEPGKCELYRTLHNDKTIYMCYKTNVICFL